MKANFIIGKRQIILASLVVVLGAAVYLNWQFAGKDKIATTNADGSSIQDSIDVLSPDGEPAEDITSKANTSSKEDTEKHLGDALLVDSKTISADDYFAKAKLTKTKTRDEAIQTMATILNDDKLKEEDKKKVTDTAISLTNTMEVESRIENLIKAKGFEDCVVYLTNNKASVVVRTDGLNADLATQIKNIVLAEGQVQAENIGITEIN